MDPLKWPAGSVVITGEVEVTADGQFSQNPAPTTLCVMAPWSIRPARVPTRPPSRYSDCVVPAADSTTWCQLPSTTLVGVVIGAADPFQNSPRSLPSPPTYSAGVCRWELPVPVSVVIGSVWYPNSTPPPPADL